MSSTLYKRLLSLLPEQPVITGALATAHPDGMATVELPGGDLIRVRNPLGLAAGGRVYVQGDAISGAAPDLDYVRIEI
jgi:hypothetical protein